MAAGNDANTARRARATRSAGLLPLVIGVASAAALTGAAYLTVDSASCGAPAQYIRHDSHVELVGGCVDGSNLPATRGPATGSVVHGNYNP
ncbi:hypothetical protein [Amycolatopsis vancoresmycina]|uniref:Uncharacterized protein n=1 Tax=Amycolatopsis vancoresmycina DSM 44592 TaxID=1292037 RepID=R1HE84_9PSEU|nr:hypothetical protein [Amycolatopsis vancoresmycina]EOD58741.1 hypothetical protein H480_42680 [Amycolatopsis vancoresmycina DSM 44592]